MSEIPSNVSQLDPILQQVIRKDVTLNEDEIKEANRDLQKVSGIKGKCL
jgi:hypothetical protein